MEDVYGDADEFQRFRRSFAKEVFTTGCEVLGRRAVDALVHAFRAALHMHAASASSPSSSSSPSPAFPSSPPPASSPRLPQQQQQHQQWHQAEVAVFALGAMASAIDAQTTLAQRRATARGVDRQQQQQQQQQVCGVGGAVGVGRGRGVPLGGTSPRGGFFSAAGAGDGASAEDGGGGGWADAELVAVDKALEQVFATIFRGGGGGGDAMPSLQAAASSAGGAGGDQALMARLLHAAAAECVGNFARWLRRHGDTTPAHAARYLTRCLREGAHPAAVAGGAGAGVRGAIANEVGDAAAVALAKLTIVCCSASGGAPGVQLCSLAVVQPLVFQVMGLPTAAGVRSRVGRVRRREKGEGRG